jgi:dTDP-4-amino-4,6-dideoxygalactose transaminase
MINIAKPMIGEEEKRAVLEVLNSGIIAQGPRVKQFESDFKDYIGMKYAIATNSGTSALKVALKTMGIKEGDEVITTPFSFIASANSILFTGAKPVFVDIEEHCFNIDPNLIKEKITKKTKAIMPVHLYGHPADMEEIMNIANDYNLKVIEDASQAHGARIRNKMVGTFGDASCFSFYPTKNMTTGEGGIIITNNQDIYEQSLKLRDHGAYKKYYHDSLGFNSRMTDMSAAIGIEQLKKLDRYNDLRIHNVNYLFKKLKNAENIVLPQIKESYKHVFHQFTIRTNNREELIKKLESNGIGYGIHYPIPIYKQKLYIDLGYKDKLPVSEKMSNEVISLPIHPALTTSDLDKIAEVFL